MRRVDRHRHFSAPAGGAYQRQPTDIDPVTPGPLSQHLEINHAGVAAGSAERSQRVPVVDQVADRLDGRWLQGIGVSKANAAVSASRKRGR